MWQVADLLGSLLVWGAVAFLYANYLSLQFWGKFVWELKFPWEK